MDQLFCNLENLLALETQYGGTRSFQKARGKGIKKVDALISIYISLSREICYTNDTQIRN